MQLGVCRTKCGTSNSFSPCVIGCKAKQVACGTKCASEKSKTAKARCVTKCVLGEEQQLGWEYDYEDGEWEWDDDLTNFKGVGVDFNLGIKIPPEEQQAQLGVCRQKCGTSNVLNSCVIGCKAKQVACGTKCASEKSKTAKARCVTKCVLGEEQQLGWEYDYEDGEWEWDDDLTNFK